MLSITDRQYEMDSDFRPISAENQYKRTALED